MAKHFVEVNSVDDLITIFSSETFPQKFILGGGSNMLLTQDIDALVVHLDLKGKTILEQTETEVLVKCQAGENWHEFVLWTLEKDFGGLENLSLNPGNVGTSPIQNIGAYGVELKDTLLRCETIKLEDRKTYIFSNKDCKFGYRNSIFKEEAKGKYIITKVIFELTKKEHVLHTKYGAIENALQNEGITSPTIKDISEAVIKIRKSKLPDPSQIGNSGSFFKNPIINTNHFMKLKEGYPNIPSYKIDNEHIKIPAGWLIENAGWKGFIDGAIGVHKKQALVLVNYGQGLGSEIYNLSEQIIQDVQLRYGIGLEREVNIY